jgi:hypothetical protein
MRMAWPGAGIMGHITFEIGLCHWSSTLAICTSGPPLPAYAENLTAPPSERKPGGIGLLPLDSLRTLLHLTELCVQYLRLFGIRAPLVFDLLGLELDLTRNVTGSVGLLAVGGYRRDERCEREDG